MHPPELPNSWQAYGLRLRVISQALKKLHNVQQVAGFIQLRGEGLIVRQMPCADPTIWRRRLSPIANASSSASRTWRASSWAAPRLAPPRPLARSRCSGTALMIADGNNRTGGAGRGQNALRRSIAPCHEHRGRTRT